MTLIRTASAEPQILAEGPGGELDARLLPWNTAAEVSDGFGVYTETWEPGSAVPASRVAVYAGHRTAAGGRVERGPLIGVARAVDNRPDGLYATLALADIADARDVRELARLVGAYVSVEAVAPTGEPGTTVVRSAAEPAEITGVAVILPPARPAHATAEVLAVRSDQEPDDPDEDSDEEEPEDEPADDPEAVVNRAEVDEMVRSAVARVAVPGAGAPVHPLAQYRTFGDFIEAAYIARSASSDDHTTLARALTNQITSDNPGVVPPGWVNEIQGIISRGRPTISAFGPFPDPGYGMEVDYPYFDGNLATLVGPQAAQKTAIVSAKVSLKKGSVPLTTLAGGSDISLQLVRRSSPSYREAYLRIMSNAYAVVSDSVAAAAALAAATGTAGPWTPAGTADQLRSAFFEASSQINAATGAPAQFALAATDVFVAIGGTPGLWPAPYGTYNAAGTATASSLRIEVSGVPVYEVPSLTAGSLLVSNGEAAGWVEDGPFPITAQDVELLGENVAIWGMGALAVPIPAGIVKIVATAATAARAK